MSETKSSPSLEELKSRVLSLQHAMQSGVAMKINYDSTDCSPKHLRVGVNSAMVEHSALTQLLFDKGIITEYEYWQSLCTWLEKEVEFYKNWLSERLGGHINLL